MIYIVLAVLAFGFIAGWVRSDALKDPDHKLAAGAAALCYAGFVSGVMILTIWAM